ncbi:MAG: hypothetical protein OEU92_28040, partial [Alphaproteobacteria bacterium]|nr:hypothetical protein [Alphaproteobacteria bacterium]
HLAPEVTTSIITRTDGVPLFVEELTKAILETGEGSVPASLHDSLMARLDRFPDVKETAQVAACIGREFSYGLLEAVADKGRPALNASLDQLAAAEIVFRRRPLPETHCTFKHALVRDAAYQSLLKSRRQQLHAKIANVLEVRFPDIVKSQPELIGHHLTRADLAEPAIGYWKQAAEYALQKSANLEAISHYQTALELLAGLPKSSHRDRSEIDLKLGLGAALIAPKSYAADEVGRAFDQAEKLSRDLNDTDRSFRAARGLWNWHLLRANLQECEALADQLSSLAARSGEVIRRLMAQRIVGTTNLAIGKYEAAKTSFARGLKLYQPTDQDTYVLHYGEDPGLICCVYAAWIDDWLGYRDQALRRLEHAMTTARKLPNQYSLCMILALSSFVYLSRRDPVETRRIAEEAMTISREQGVVQWLHWSTTLCGWAMAASGDVAAGLELAKKGYRDWCVLGGLYEQPKFLALLADIHHMSGDWDKGLTCLGEAEVIVRDVGLGQWIPELYRRKGDLLVDVSRFTDAEAQFERAIEIARKQHAKTFELRAAMSLARLWRDQGKTNQAQSLLAPIYAWFSEGFDTVDLKEAKSILEELA